MAYSRGSFQRAMKVISTAELHIHLFGKMYITFVDLIF